MRRKTRGKLLPSQLEPRDQGTFGRPEGEHLIANELPEDRPGRIGRHSIVREVVFCCGGLLNRKKRRQQKPFLKAP
jgi:hypothetical protein